LQFAKTPGELIAEVKMERAGYFKGALLVVEALSDKKVWTALVRPQACRVLLSFSKSCALKALQLLGSLDEAFGMLVVLDDDFDALLGRRLVNDNAIYTDAHDLESVLIRSGALDRVIAEFVDSELLVTWESREQSHIRERILQNAKPVGNVRLVAQRDRWDVSFASLSCFSLYDESIGAVNITRLAEFITRQNPAISPSYVSDIAVLQFSHDLWHLCHGSDLLTILCILLKDQFGVRHIGPESLFSHLRVGFSKFDFEQTQMFKDVTAWEARTGLAVLA
jgi:hypothetical protein